MAKIPSAAEIVERAQSLRDLEQALEKARADFEAWVRGGVRAWVRGGVKATSIKKLLGKKRKKRGMSVSDQIIKALAGGRMGIQDMIKETGGNPKTLRVTVSTLKKRGILKAHGKGVYSIK